jgi:hypothetical protein
MKARTKAPTIALLVLAFSYLPGYAGQSLPEFARQERARREANPVESIRVFTNENLPRGPQPGPPDRVQAGEVPDEPPSPAGTPDEAPSAETAPVTEDEWRTLFAEARTEIQRAENSLTLLRLERAELSQQLLTRDDIYNRELQLQPRIQEKEEQLAAGQARLDTANKALADLQEALRRSGSPAGWGRP